MLRKVPTRGLECPKCFNRRLYSKYLGQYRNMSYDDINNCLKSAKKFDQCQYITHVLGRNVFVFSGGEKDGTFSPPTYSKENTVWAFFCRCGYYSLNPYDFNDGSKEDDSYKIKREFQMEKKFLS